MTRKEYIEDPKLQMQESLLLKLFPADATITIFDIGACEGESSIRYARLFPKSQIYTFEPLPGNFKLIQGNIFTYNTGNIHPKQLCLSDQSGETMFYVSSGKPDSVSGEDWDYGNKSSSLLAPAKAKEVYRWLKFENTVIVQTETLDNFCQNGHISKIDFIHIDVQGAELMVLTGARQMLPAINCIWLEVEAVELYKGQPLKADVEDFMRNNGFVKTADTVYSEAGDQFWVRKEFMRKNKLRTKIGMIQFQSALVAIKRRLILKLKKR